MRGRGSLAVQKLRFLLTSPRVRLGRGVDSSVLTTPLLQQHLHFIGRSGAVDYEFVDYPCTFLKIVRTERIENLTQCPSHSGRVNERAQGRALAAVTPAPPYSSPSAAIPKVETIAETTAGSALFWKNWCYQESLLSSFHPAGCSPQSPVFFSTLGQHVKEAEDEDERRHHRLRSSGNSSSQREDAGNAVTKDFSEDSKASPSFRRIEQDDDVQKNPDRLAKESRVGLAWSEAGWTREEVWNWPNSISMARLLSGPVLAWMILHEMWNPALIGLVIAGVSDWLDGYVARKMEINSVLGSYLDPVADKVLVGSVALSMAYAGLLHSALVALVIARDGVLVGGAFVYRAYSLRWQWRNWREFFRISIGGAGKVEPLFISKINTVLQLCLIGVALGQPALRIEDTYSLVPLLSWSVAGTTTISWGCYVYQYLKHPDSLAALRHIPKAPTHIMSATGVKATVILFLSLGHMDVSCSIEYDLSLEVLERSGVERGGI
ncbi:hypothetical protein R1flu_009733 [Riccia fluitans]|uniref:Uncharacterized protein n=1 Tax=Riccia fluitans TaxID=41844 RepID=A0ABD1Z2Z5_9MARC